MVKKFNTGKDNILGILHELQNNNPQNYLSEEDLKDVAAYLNTTLSQVYGVATYYSMFSLKPRGKYIIRICNSPVCNMEGAPVISDILREILGVAPGGTTKDGLFSIEYTECLGRCEVAPGMMVGQVVYGDLDRNKILLILKQYK